MHYKKSLRIVLAELIVALATVPTCIFLSALSHSFCPGAADMHAFNNMLMLSVTALDANKELVRYM